MYIHVGTLTLLGIMGILNTQDTTHYLLMHQLFYSVSYVPQLVVDKVALAAAQIPKCNDLAGPSNL